MSFPLFRRPGTIVFLDDDTDYLDMLSVVLPRHWHVKLFVRPNDCINYLQQEPPFWEADTFEQQTLIERWRDGTPLIPQVLGYWSKYAERFALARVCVVDYSMPAMDGLQALSELVDWPGSRVLLTGQADEQVAVRAFNSGLIEQFIAKQTPDISRKLVDAVERLLIMPNARQAHIWHTTLSPAQNALLRVPSIGRELTAFAVKRWVEHVVIGEPFGVLGVDAMGQAGWLQLETTASLETLAEVAEVAGVSAGGVQDIRLGRKLADLEIRQSLAAPEPPQLRPAFPVGSDGSLLGALFNLEPRFCPPPESCYTNWLARQGKRSIQD